MIDEKILHKLEKLVIPHQHLSLQMLQLPENVTGLELIHLAKLGLEFKELIDKENGKANLMAVIRLGREAKQNV